MQGVQHVHGVGVSDRAVPVHCVRALPLADIRERQVSHLQEELRLVPRARQHRDPAETDAVRVSLRVQAAVPESVSGARARPELRQRKDRGLEGRDRGWLRVRTPVGGTERDTDAPLGVREQTGTADRKRKGEEQRLNREAAAEERPAGSTTKPGYRGKWKTATVIAGERGKPSTFFTTSSRRS